MKKLGLTAALGSAMFTAAFAQDGHEHNGPFQVEIKDFITIDPSGPSNFPMPSVSFSNPSQMVDGLEIGPQKYKVTASRAWKAQVTATDFTRAGNDAPPTVTTSFPASTSLQMKSTFSSVAPVGTVYTAYPFTYVSSAGVVIAQADHGGVAVEFDLVAKLAPGLSYNLSGDYESSVTVIASLD